MDRASFESALGKGAATLRLELGPGVTGALATYLLEMRRWGAKMNLTGSLEPERLIEHTLDSLGVAPAIPEDARVLDVGSGGGFPAIPLAVLRPDLELTLVEATARKCAFLRHVIRTLGLSRCRVEEGRLEALPALLEAFDVAVSRAAMAPDAWLEAGLKLVRPCGRVLLLLAAGAAAPAGGERLGYELPGGLQRVVAIHRRPGTDAA